MPPQDNEAIVRRAVQEFNRGGLAEDLYSPRFRSQKQTERASGPEGVREVLSKVREAFPDVQLRIEDIRSQGDEVIARISARGSHRGGVLATAPTGKQASWTSIHTFRIDDGQIVEHSVAVDEAQLKQQLMADSS